MNWTTIETIYILHGSVEITFPCLDHRQLFVVSPDPALMTGRV